MPKLKIPSLMLFYVNGEKEIELKGASILEVLINLINRYPNIKKQIFDGNNNLRRHINIFINDQNINDLGLLETPISENDIIRIIPSISGG